MKHEIGMCDFDDSYDWQPSNKKNNEGDVPPGVRPTPKNSDNNTDVDSAPAIKKGAISLAVWLIKNRGANVTSVGERAARDQGMKFINEMDATRPQEMPGDLTTGIKSKAIENFSTPSPSPAASRALVLSL